MPKSSEEILCSLHDAFSACEYDHINQFMDEQVRYYVPGYGPFAGTYRGIDDVVALLRRAAAHRNQHTLIIQELGVSSSDWHIAERSVRQALVNGKSVEWNQTTLYFFDQGRIRECRIVVSNPEAYDEYWSLSEEQIAEHGGDTDTSFDLANRAGRDP